MDACTAQGIDTETDLCAANRIHVDDVVEVVDVAIEKIVSMRRRSTQSLLVRDSFYLIELGFEQRVGLCLYPIGDDSVRRAAVG